MFLISVLLQSKQKPHVDVDELDFNLAIYTNSNNKLNYIKLHQTEP